MNYEQLEVYFGPPGVSIIYPTVGMKYSPSYMDLDFHRVIAHEKPTPARVQWEAIFSIARNMRGVLSRRSPGYDHLTLRTGILCPKSVEGKNFYGKVLLLSLRLDKPMGPGQLELFPLRVAPHKNVALIPRWDMLPESIPLPEYEDRVPLPVRQAWFKGLTDVPNAPAALGLNVWEELL